MSWASRTSKAKIHKTDPGEFAAVSECAHGFTIANHPLPGIFTSIVSREFSGFAVLSKHTLRQARDI
jgi:hypothetical protein